MNMFIVFCSLVVASVIISVVSCIANNTFILWLCVAAQIFIVVAEIAIISYISRR